MDNRKQAAIKRSSTMRELDPENSMNLNDDYMDEPVDAKELVKTAEGEKFNLRLKELTKANNVYSKRPAKKRRKSKQKKLGMFFETETNFQGFKTMYCRYQPELNDKVFVPKEYGEKAKKYKLDCSFCRYCLLGPCITIEHPVGDVCYYYSVQQRMYNKDIRPRVEATMRDFLTDLFGKKYMRKMPTPRCVVEAIAETAPGGDDSSDSSADEEEFVCFENNEDGKETVGNTDSDSEFEL